MTVAIGLGCVAALLIVAFLGLATARTQIGTTIVYGACSAISAVALFSALIALVARVPATPEIILPLGLPWVGVHFRVDALAAFFLVVVNLGGATASLYALGHGRYETAPQRVLPFYPAFLGAINLVVLADDAFSFLLSWEFMSLTSWALVMAHHRGAGNMRAGYVYLVMASFGTMALLLALVCLPGRKAVTPLRRCAPDPTRLWLRHSFSRWRFWGRDQRQGWFRCMSGCRWPTRRRQAMSRR